MKNLFYSLVLITGLFLTGCANAGKDQKVISESLVTLDGKSSIASVGGKLTRYYWKQVRGEKVTLSHRRSLEATFVAPVVTKATRLIFKLTTIEYGGRFSPFRTRDYVYITIEPSSDINKAPQAIATVSSHTVKEGDNVTFDASTSTDSDGQIATYSWKDTNGDELSSAATFTHTFVDEGTHTITLTVTDDDDASTSTDVSITVEALVEPVAVVTTSATNIWVNATVTFDASGSSDADGEIVTYKWLDAQGNTLSTEANFTHTFDAAGEHNIMLEVMDDDEQITSTSVIITVKALLETIYVTSEVQTLLVTENTQLTATGNYNDQSTLDITTSAVWTSSDTSVATVDANGTVTAIAEGTVSIFAMVSDIDSEGVVLVVELPEDTVKPVITINAGTDTIVAGTNHTDAGATATDDRDGTVEVTVQNNVDTTTKGTYTIVYTATDAAGNTETQIRTVIVSSLIDTNSTDIQLSGVISDRLGNFLSGVKVFSRDKVTFTDINGSYSISIEADKNISISTKIDEYMQNSHTVLSSNNIKLNMILVKFDVIQQFNVNESVTIKDKGAEVSFSASSIVNIDGSIYDGEVIVKMYFNNVSAYTGRRVFPGEYMGLNIENNIGPIDSRGFLDVVIEDIEGNPLRLADNKNATLTYPNAISNTDPIGSIPLWFYDIKKGLWIEEGNVTYDSTTNTYIGIVHHFTTWNYGINYFHSQASLFFSVEENNGSVVSDVEVLLSAGYYTSFDYASTQNLHSTEGNYIIKGAPANGILPFSLTVYAKGKSTSSVNFTLNNGDNLNLGTLILDQNESSNLVTIKGVVPSAPRMPIKNINREWIAFTVPNDTTGYFEVSFPRPLNNKILLFDSDNIISTGTVFSLDPQSDVTNLGNLLY